MDKQTLEAHRFKLSKAKLQMHWAVAKKQTDDCQGDLRRVEQEIDDVRDVQAIEITTQKQKLKHLLLELHSGAYDECFNAARSPPLGTGRSAFL